AMAGAADGAASATAAGARARGGLRGWCISRPRCGGGRGGGGRRRDGGEEGDGRVAVQGAAALRTWRWAYSSTPASALLGPAAAAHEVLEEATASTASWRADLR
ncbi:unnamed protein product, partial [Prorocentrum cordatum]